MAEYFSRPPVTSKSNYLADLRPTVISSIGYGFLYSVPLSLLNPVFSFLKRGQFNSSDLTASVSLAVSLGLFIAYYDQKVTPYTTCEGIGSSRKGRRPKFIPWSDIVHVERVGYYGQASYRFRTDDGQYVDVPTRVPVKKMRLAVELNMPADHPLRYHILTTVLPPGKPSPSDPS